MTCSSQCLAVSLMHAVVDAHRQQRMLAQLAISERVPGSDYVSSPVSTACWVGESGDIFATGHASGDVGVWGVPKSEPGLASAHANTGLSQAQPLHACARKAR